MENHEKMATFNAMLEERTGNSYDTYISVSSAMRVIGEAHLDDVETSVRAYIKVFGLGDVRGAVFNLREAISAENRYRGTLYDFAVGSVSRQWEIDGAGGICRSGASGTDRISVLSTEGRGLPPQYVLEHSSGVSEQPVSMVGTLRLREQPIEFSEVVRGYDMVDFVAYIIPGMATSLDAKRGVEVEASDPSLRKSSRGLGR